jgi:hypothetical protein
MQYLGNREPSLDEVFDDPIVRLVMARDRILPDEVRAYVDAARRSLGELVCLAVARA